MGAVFFVSLLPDLFQTCLWSGEDCFKGPDSSCVAADARRPLNFVVLVQSQLNLHLLRAGVLVRVYVPVLSHVLLVWVTSGCCSISRSTVYVPFLVSHAASARGPGRPQSQSGSCYLAWQCLWARGSCHRKQPWLSSLQPHCLGISLRLWLANAGSKKSPKLFPFLEEKLFCPSVEAWGCAQGCYPVLG